MNGTVSADWLPCGLCRQSGRLMGTLGMNSISITCQVRERSFKSGTEQFEGVFIVGSVI